MTCLHSDRVSMAVHANATRLYKYGVIHMLRATNLAALFMGTALISLPAFSQEVGRSEASVQFMGTFTKQTDSNGIRQSSSDSGGVLASYRFFFTRHQGVELNYGY
jgi:hypothetical protein